MKRIVTFAVMLISAISMSAQKTVHSVSVELLGAQNMVGVNYDSRLKGNSGLGYRVGVGFGYGDNSGWFDQTIKGVGVPMELNYLLGRKRHKLEAGIGTSLGIYHVKETAWYWNEADASVPGYEGDRYTTTSNRFGYLIFGDIGYRYQRDNGFMFRIGVSPSFNFGDKYGLDKSAFYPYVGFGWSF